MRSDGAVKPQNKAFVSTAAGSRSKDAREHNSNASKWCEHQQRPSQLLLSLQIITVAAAVFTTAACANAFVIADAAANVAIAEDRTVIVALRPISSISEKRLVEQHIYNNSNLSLKTYTNKNENKNKNNYDARNCYELMRNDPNNRNAINSERKNIIENFKCVVYRINENLTYSTKALTQNNENTDFKNIHRISELHSNVDTMTTVAKGAIWANRKLGPDSTERRMPTEGKHSMDGAATKADDTNYNYNALPFLTVFWFTVCGFATSLLNIQTYAAKMLSIPEALMLYSWVNNNCDKRQHNAGDSGSALLAPSSVVLTQKLSIGKSLPQAQLQSVVPAARISTLHASLSAGSTSQKISAINPRLSFTISYVMYAAFIIFLLPAVRSEEGDNFFAVNTFSMIPETTTPEFDYAGRGKKKFGDKCDGTLECGFPGSICDAKKKSCQCTEDLPVTNHIDKCGKEAAVNESCFFNEQCEVRHYQTECRDGRCACRYEMQPFWGKDGTVECKGRGDKRGPETYIDPAMIGVLVGMALMFVIICVVLRLFSQARWRENRTIFNTPNPRLMNVSLLRDSKLLHGQERRGSRMSVRAPSRQPSMASLRPHSPNPSLVKTDHKSSRMTRSKSNTRSSDSRVSDVSNCSRLLEHSNTNAQHAPHTFAPYTSTTTHITNLQSSPQSIPPPISTATANANTNSDTELEAAMCLTTPPPVAIKANKF
ncbi:PREDICTED: uncharacterized protein LOC108367767 [Rhagoletis zephyria]|uniref:uncharacterized protein LOC108367767 n=1 Tax=Rhagoletis zephyria TaxID=28612 RepID=UPI0008117BC6|nr:PREDICTED: uncharacterized protein LOC108367767 [Rhagoletis zephyria]